MLTRIQLEIWMNDPVTEAFLQCMDDEWVEERNLNGARKSDPHNADYSHALTFKSEGYREALEVMSTPTILLDRYGVVEEEEDEEGN